MQLKAHEDSRQEARRKTAKRLIILINRYKSTHWLIDPLASIDRSQSCSLSFCECERGRPREEKTVHFHRQPTEGEKLGSKAISKPGQAPCLWLRFGERLPGPSSSMFFRTVSEMTFNCTFRAPKKGYGHSKDSRPPSSPLPLLQGPVSWTPSGKRFWRVKTPQHRGYSDATLEEPSPSCTATHNLWRWSTTGFAKACAEYTITTLD